MYLKLPILLGTTGTQNRLVKNIIGQVLLRTCSLLYHIRIYPPHMIIYVDFYVIICSICSYINDISSMFIYYTKCYVLYKYYQPTIQSTIKQIQLLYCKCVQQCTFNLYLQKVEECEPLNIYLQFNIVLSVQTHLDLNASFFDPD